MCNGSPSERRTHCTARWKTISLPAIAASTARGSRIEPCDDPHVAPALRLAQIGARAGREVVEDGDRPVLGHEMVDQMAADEPCPAGDQAAADHSAACRSEEVVRRLASSEDCARSSMSMIRNPLRPSMIERSRPAITLPKWATTSANGSQSDTRGA